MPLEGLGKLKTNKKIHRTRTRDLLACNIVPQPLRYNVPKIMLVNDFKLKRSIIIPKANMKYNKVINCGTMIPVFKQNFNADNINMLGRLKLSNTIQDN
jgi:hypothetical protein